MYCANKSGILLIHESFLLKYIHNPHYLEPISEFDKFAGESIFE